MCGPRRRALVSTKSSKSEKAEKSEKVDKLTNDDIKTYLKALADRVLAAHQPGTLLSQSSTLSSGRRACSPNWKAALPNHRSKVGTKIAPTSLVFGAWDSRDTQAKLPRLIASTIRAFDVRRLTRSAQYVPAAEYVEHALLEEPTDEKTRKAYAERGFVHVPASGSHGGVIATGGIRRDATLHLAALRLLTAGGDAAKTLTLRRYVLGLALTALTHSPSGYLRQGCNLVLDPDPDPDPKKKREFKTVYGDGRREDATVTHSEALTYAKAAAKAFGIDPDRKIDYKASPDKEVMFDVELAKKDVSGDTGNGTKAARKSRKTK